MNVRQIVKEYLIKNQYQGLFSDYEYEPCGCDVDDLINCDECCSHCKPGYKFIPQCVCDDYEYYIGECSEFECYYCDKPMKRVEK